MTTATDDLRATADGLVESWVFGLRKDYDPDDIQHDLRPALSGLDVELLWIIEGHIDRWAAAAAAAKAAVRERMAKDLGDGVQIKLGDDIYERAVVKSNAQVRNAKTLWDWLLYGDGAHPDDVVAVINPTRAARKTAVEQILVRRAEGAPDGAEPQPHILDLLSYNTKCECGDWEGKHVVVDEDVVPNKWACEMCDCAVLRPLKALKSRPAVKVGAWAVGLAHAERRTEGDSP